MKPILVSVLIPSYNSEKWLAQTLRSVLAQTHKELEVIVVDDGSTDRSVEVATEFRDHRVRVLEASHSGAAKTRNLAYLASSGDYIQFLDADDLISPNKIECQLERLLGSPDSVTVCKWGRFVADIDDVRIDPSSAMQDSAPIDWLVETWRSGAGMLFPAMWLVPRKVLERAGMWREDLSLNDDGEFFTRVVLASSGVLFCDAAIAYYRSGIAGSLSSARSSAAWQSGFKAIESTLRETFAHENSERVRRCGALMWQVYAHAAHPYQPKLADEALRNARNLHPVTIRPGGGAMFRIASAIFGWKAARTLQKWSGRA
ncbi:MAG: glycosyltransferase family 2 protein [Ramlibacter sp.]|nr:glycosyltransferase family 2 protein [Ramlibacter sp.]